jgi:hypothetical protein
MHDYMSVLASLHAHAADQRSRALLNSQAEVANMTTERTLRNRAKAICLRLLDLPASERTLFAERATRHL